MHNIKSLQKYHCTLHSHNLTFTTLIQFDFRLLHLHNLKSLSTIWLYSTLAQPDFHYTCTTWFQRSTLAQPEIFIFMVKWHISRFTRTSWFSLHSENMISVAFFCFVCMFSYIYIFRTATPTNEQIFKYVSHLYLRVY